MDYTTLTVALVGMVSTAAAAIAPVVIGSRNERHTWERNLRNKAETQATLFAQFVRAEITFLTDPEGHTPRPDRSMLESTEVISAELHLHARSEVAEAWYDLVNRRAMLWWTINEDPNPERMPVVDWQDSELVGLKKSMNEFLKMVRSSK